MKAIVTWWLCIVMSIFSRKQDRLEDHAYCYQLSDMFLYVYINLLTLLTSLPLDFWRHGDELMKKAVHSGFIFIDITHFTSNLYHKILSVNGKYVWILSFGCFEHQSFNIKWYLSLTSMNIANHNNAVHKLTHSSSWLTCC